MLLASGMVQAATLDVVVAGVRNAKGEVWVAVCSEARFLQETCEHMAQVPAREGEVTVRLENVPPGVWSVQAFHDEDMDGKIDTLLGVPTEGLGFSNDVRFRFGPPKFGEAAFQLSPAGGRIRFSLRYQF